MLIALLELPHLLVCAAVCSRLMADCEAAEPLQGLLLQGPLLHRDRTLCPAPASRQARPTAGRRLKGSCSVQGP